MDVDEGVYVYVLCICSSRCAHGTQHVFTV